MKNFENVPNASGTWPNVVAVPCSGPGETDGTARTAFTRTDRWGWIQALLNSQNMTPNGSAETSSASQILTALKTLIKSSELLPIGNGRPNHDPTTRLPDWIFILGAGLWVSKEDDSPIIFPLDLPVGVTIDLTITARVNPGAARTGVDRMFAALKYLEYGDTSSTPVGSEVYDDGTTNTQTITLVSNDLVTSAGRHYFVHIKAGDDGGSHNDDNLYSVNRSFVLS